MRLNCTECGRVTVLDAAQQKQALAELTQPAHMKIIECQCGQFQFAIAARLRAGSHVAD